MNKFTKLLSVFVLAGAIGAGAGAFAGCAHKHTFSSEWETDANNHWHAATCEHEEEKDSFGAHVDADADGKCDVCKYDMPKQSSVIPLPDGVNNLLVDDSVVKLYELSATTPAANINTAEIKVYFAKGNEKAGEVPAENLKFKLTLGKDEITDLTAIRKEGTYAMQITLVNVTGGESLIGAFNIEIKNPVSKIELANSDTATLSVKQGGDASAMTATWKFKATRANGDSEDVADVEIGGIDNLSVGAHNVTVTDKASGKTCTVAYTVTDDDSLAVQSYAIKASDFASASFSQGVDFEIDSANKVWLTAAGNKTLAVDANKKEVDERQFTHRMKVQGIYATSSGKAGNSIKFENLNDATGLAEGAKVSTTITVYAMSSSSSDTRAISIAKEGAEGLEIDTTQARVLPGDKLYKITFTVSEAGTYHVACWDPTIEFPDLDTTGYSMKTGGWNAYYIQVDKMITGDAAQQDKTLNNGTDEISEFEVKYTGEKDLHVDLGTDFDDTIKALYTYKAIYINSVTCIVKEEKLSLTEAITFDVPADFKTVPGKKEITVTYSGKTATITVYVDSAVSGVTGAKISIDTALNTEVTAADQKITVKLADIKAEMEGSHEGATVVLKSATYAAKGATGDGTAITAEGVQVGVGEYVVTAVVDISADGKTATFTVTCDLKVKVKTDVTTWLYQDTYATPDASDPGLQVDDQITTNSLFTAKALDTAKSGKARKTEFSDKTAGDKQPIADKSLTPTGEAKAFTNALSFDTKPGTAGKYYIEITANANITVYVYMNLSDDSHGSERNDNYITYQIDSETPVETVIAKTRTVVTVVKVTLTKDQKLKVGAKNATGKTDPRVWFYGIEAVETTAAATATAATAPVAILPKKDY